MADETIKKEGEGGAVPGAEKDTTPTPRPTRTPDEKVEISKKTLEKILERLETQDKYIEESKERDKKRDSQIEMLKSISDKARLMRYEEQTRGSLIRTAKVSFWEGSPILGWMKGKDEVGFREGRLQVNQTIKLFLDKGEKEPDVVEVDYLFWAQNVDGETGEVVEKLERDGNQYWTIQMKDGRKVTLDIRFINAF